MFSFLSFPATRRLFFAFAVVLFSCDAMAQVISGGDLVHRSCGFVAPNESWTLDETGYVGTYIIQPSDGQIRFSVVVSGDPGSSTPPVMDVHIGGLKWTYQVSGNNQTISENGIDIPSGTHAVRIELTRGTIGFDRKLTIHSFELTDNDGAVSRISNLDDEVNALNAADSYIANWRCGEFKLTLKDGVGQNVVAGENVRIRLKRHAFNFGICLPGVNSRAKWLKDDANGVTFREKASQQPMFSMFGCDNGAKWRVQEGTRDLEKYGYTDLALDFAEQSNMRFRWHALMWGGHDPDWAHSLEVAAQTKITISGITYPLMNGTYSFNRPFMFGDPYTSNIDGVFYAVYRWRNPSNPSEVKWLIGQSNPRVVYFSSDDPVVSPLEVTNWVAQNGATGSPVFADLPDAGAMAARLELRGEITERIQGIIRQRSHRYEEIDGMNEAFNVELGVRSLGGIAGSVKVYDEAGLAAQQAATANGTQPARVITNDYAILRSAYNVNRVKWVAAPGGRDWYRNFYRRHVESLILEGGEDTVGGIGIQGHVRGALPDEDETGTRNITLKTYRKPLQTLAVLEKPISITEFSLDADTSGTWTDAEKYDVVNKAMRIVFGSDQTSTFHYWGFYDPWDGVFTGLYNADWTISPIGEAWRDLTAGQWNTDFVTTVDEKGQIVVPSAFFGDYEVLGVNGFSYSATATLKGDNTSVTLYDGGQANFNPTATITTPINGFTGAPGQLITFIGSGQDAEDGEITGSGLVWMSDRDGQLGTGKSIAISSLSEGSHVITLISTDSDSLIGNDELSITIEILPDDMDGDGMSDEWEINYFGGIAQTNGGPEEDWDHDGQSNLEEYIWGVNPTSASSFFKLHISEINGELHVTYPANAATGTMYQNKQRHFDLYSSSDLKEGMWTQVNGETNVIGDDTTRSYKIQGAESRMFFRLEVWLQ